MLDFFPQNSTKQINTVQNRLKQYKTDQNSTQQIKTVQNRSKEIKTVQNRSKQYKRSTIPLKYRSIPNMFTSFLHLTIELPSQSVYIDIKYASLVGSESLSHNTWENNMLKPF